MRKKFLGIMLCASLAMGLLSGCSSPQQSETETAETTAAEAEAESETSEAEETEAESDEFQSSIMFCGSTSLYPII